MRATIQGWGPLVLVLAAALWLRVADLSRRPMHADEANQGVKAGELVETGRYAFDPRDHHGPTLYYATRPVAWLRGQHTLAQLDETTLRLVPALAGTAAVWLLLLLAAPLGRWPALAAAAFLAVSPAAVYFSRYFIQEMLLVTFTLGAAVCAQRWWRGGHAGWAVATGVCAGLMLATKASAPLFAFAGLVGLGLSRAGPPCSRHPARDALLSAGAAFIPMAAFYTSFGTHFSGLGDFFAGYGHLATRLSGPTGHEKPWWYYLEMFGWQRSGGLVWQQVAFATLAIIGAAAAFVSGPRLLRWAAGYTLVVATVLSLTPYKTPWHAVHLVPALALLAAGALAVMPARWLGPVAALLALGLLAHQTRLAAFLRPADTRNPYAYVHSSPDVLKYRGLVEAALQHSPGRPVRIIGEEYWPLPWYLRGLPRVGYWNTPPAECDGALVITTAGQSAGVRARLHGTYTEAYLGLRPGVICTVFTPQP
jgi:uncharacterized protein (TIGR03663 family)